MSEHPNVAKRPKLEFSQFPATEQIKSKSSSSTTKAPSELWVDKYRPRQLSDLVGNASKINFLREWLASWQVNHNKGSRTPKAIIISGSPGVGKSTAAKLICDSLGFVFFEVNASDSRNKSGAVVAEGISGSLSSKVREMVTNTTMNIDGTPKRMVLIMEEVDGMSSGDRGGVTELISMIKLTKIPIICVCNDRYSPRLKSLLPHCEDCAFQRPMKQQILKRIAHIVSIERVSVTQNVLETLVQTCENDIRLILNQLQMLQMETRVDIALSGITVKDVPGNPFSIVDKLFSSPACGALHVRERLALSESELVPLFVQENYINMRPSDTQFDRLQLLATAATRLSDADTIGKAVYTEQRWSLLPAFVVCGTILPSSVMAGKREILSNSAGERNFNRFPSLLGKLSSRSKINRLCSEIALHFSTNRSCAETSTQLRLEYYPTLRLNTLRAMTFSNKGGREHDGIDEIISFMKEYDLTRSDWETLHDSTRLNGKGPVFQQTTTVLSSKIKSAFTKACKKHLK